MSSKQSLESGVDHVNGITVRAGVETTVAFRSAKVAFFRGAKGDNTTVIVCAILNGVSASYLVSFQLGAVYFDAESGALGYGDHAVDDLQRLDQQVVLELVAAALVAVGQGG